RSSDLGDPAGQRGPGGDLGLAQQRLGGLVRRSWLQALGDDDQGGVIRAQIGDRPVDCGQIEPAPGGWADGPLHVHQHRPKYSAPELVKDAADGAPGAARPGRHGKMGAVTWKAPDVERPDGPLTGPERPMLQAFLDWHRATLLYKCGGLTGAQLAAHTVPPSGLSLLGLIRHMTKVERTWFRQRFAGEPVGPPFGEDKAADFERVDPARAAEEYARHLGHADLLREQIDGATGE